MSEEDSTSIDRTVNEPEKLSTKRWVRQGVMILVAVVVASILYRTAASFLPRWWAESVAGQADGDSTAGTLWGLLYGFAFTFVPLTLLFQIRRSFFTWKARIIVVIIAVALAAPNWLTLSVVVGNSDAARAGKGFFDAGAPGFRLATLIGVVVGALLAILLSATSMVISRRRHQVKELKQQVKDNKREKSQPSTPGSPKHQPDGEGPEG